MCLCRCDMCSLMCIPLHISWKMHIHVCILYICVVCMIKHMNTFHALEHMYQCACLCMSPTEPLTLQCSQPPSHQLSSSPRFCAPAPPDVSPILLPLTHLFIQQIQTDTVSLYMPILSSKASGISFTYSQQAWGTRHQSPCALMHRYTLAFTHRHEHSHTDLLTCT